MPVIDCDVKVLEHLTLNDTIRLMTTSWPRRDRAPKAGQFFMLRCWPEDAAPLLSRPISVHNYDAATGTLQFLYEVKGKGTEKLAALQPGDTLHLVGPSGKGFDVEEAAAKRVALVGGGIGTAPLYQLAKSCVQRATVPTTTAVSAMSPTALKNLPPCAAKYSWPPTAATTVSTAL